MHRIAPAGIIAILGLAIAARTSAQTMNQTYINEFPHPRVNVHYHPHAGHEFTLSDAQYALDHHCNDIELDLHMRGSDVICNHDGPTPEAPRLADVVDLVVRTKGNSPTMYGNGRQFFLVLEPKDNDPALFDGIVNILASHAASLSTSVGPNDPPRGITIVMTGAWLGEYYAHFADRRADLNRLCIVEHHDYSREIVNHTKGGIPFQWTSIQHPEEKGRVNAIHNGTDAHLKGQYNIRVWGEGENLIGALASGADSINCDHAQVLPFQKLLRNEGVSGHNPALAVRGNQAAAVWRGTGSDNLYLALGTATSSGLSFDRQILMTFFLEGSPTAVEPSVAIYPDGRLLIVDEEGADHALYAVEGKFISPERFLRFTGGKHPLTAGGRALRGQHAKCHVADDGSVVITYESADGGLNYISGKLNGSGQISSTEKALNAGMEPE